MSNNLSQATGGLATLSVKAGGSPLDASFQVLSMEVSLEINRIPSAQILILDGDPAKGTFEASMSPKLAPGEEIQVMIGYNTQNKEVFKGVIVRQSIQFRDNLSVVRIDCRAKSYKLTLNRKSKVFYEKKDSDLIKTLAQGSGLQVSVDATTQQHKEMVQYHTSDWDFLICRAEANGLIVNHEGTKLKVEKPVLSGSPVATLQYGRDLVEFSAEIDGREQVKSVSVSAWSPKDQAMLNSKGSSSGTSGLGGIKERDLQSNVGPSEYELIHGGMLQSQELKSWAEARAQRHALGRMRGTATIQGSAAILPGKLVEFDRLGKSYDGKAYVTAVQHVYDEGGWETRIQFGLDPELHSRRYADVQTLPAEGLLPGIHGLQFGVVTKLSGDPENEHRLRVRIPAVETSGEGVWARIGSLDAGKERGWFYRPEVGDEVIVGFIHDDPRYPVVLGQLHSSKNAPPLTETEDNHQKGYFSREKMRLLFDDQKKSITLDTPKGKKLILDDDGGSITLEDENGNKIVMDSQGISIETPKKLTLKATQDAALEGMNVEVKASTQLKASGSAGAEVSSSANLVLKGALVQIN
jgi:Rhs element Vgr protein